MELDLRYIFRVARRRWWIPLLLMVVAGGMAYANSARQTAVYTASATMLVSPGGASEAGTDYSSLLASEMLAETYRQLIVSGPMLERTADALGVEELESGIHTAAIPSTQLVQVTVTDTSAERAALVANTLVEEFQQYVSERASERAETTRSGIDAQIADLEARLEEIESDLASLRSDGAPSDVATEQRVAALTREQGTINEALTNLRASAITFDAEVMSQSAQVEMADPATVPESPTSPRPVRAAALGAIVGVLLAVGLIALLEFLDNTVKPESQVHALTGAPLLATVAALPRLQPGAGQVYMMSQPKSSATEAVRLLRTNLEFASASGEVRVLTVTSPGPGEGKSTLVANLGVAMAQAGSRVVIVDGDLRKPTQHRIFGVTNDTGVTTLVTHPEHDWVEVARKVALPGLQLLPSGPVPPNPSDLVSATRFETLIERIKLEADIVVIDSPPILAASDALSIAVHTDGVVLVAQAGQTRVDAVRHAAHAVHQGGIRLIGVVLNRQKGQQGASYYGEYYGAAAQAGD